MYFDSIKYMALLETAAKSAIRSGDVRQTKLLEYYNEIDYGSRYIPSSVDSINKFNAYKTGDRPGSEELNLLVRKLKADQKVANRVSETFRNHVDYLSSVFAFVDTLFIRSMAELNDSIRTASSNEITLPYIQAMVPTKTSNCSRTICSIFPEPVIKDILDYSEVSLLYEGDASISGDFRGTLLGRDASFYKEYSPAGMKLKFIISSDKEFNTVVIGLKDGMEHRITIDKKTCVTSGAVVFSGKKRQSIIVDILTTDYTNDKKHLLIVDYVYAMDVDYFKDGLVEMGNNMLGVTPLSIYPTDKGVYSGSGAAMLNIYDGKWKGFANYRNGTHSGYITQIANSKMSLQRTITDEIDSVSIDNTDINRLYGLYGLKDDSIETPNGYKEHEGKKYSFAYLSGEEVLNGVTVYDLSGKAVNNIKPGAYVLEYEDDPEIDLYAHCSIRDDDITITGDTLEIPLEVEKEMQFESFKKNGVIIPTSYSVSGEDAFFKADFFNQGTFTSEEIMMEGNTITIETGTYVQPGTKSRYGLMAFVAAGNNYFYPWDVSLVEPISSDGEDVELSISFDVSEYSGEQIQYYIIKSRAKTYTLSKDRFYYCLVSCSDYLGDVILVPMIDDSIQYAQTINKKNRDEITVPFTGEISVGIKTQKDIEVNGIAVIPVIPETVTTAETDYLLNYTFEGVARNYSGEEFAVSYDSVDESGESAEIGRTFRLKISGSDSGYAYIKYRRLPTDYALFVYEQPKTFDPKIKIELFPVREGFQPVVTNPVIGVVLK